MSLTPFFSANGLSVGNLFNPTNVVLANGSITAGNTVTANYFIGNGALLTGIGASTSYSNANVAAYLPNYQGQISNIDFRSTSPAAVALVSNSRPLTMGGNTLSYVTLPDDANANVIAAELTNHGLGNVLISSGPGDHEWIFDHTGNLTLPGNVWSVYYANGTQVALGGAGNYGNSNVADYLASNANVTIVTTGNITGSYISGNGIATTTVSATPPANPEQGDIWIRSDTGIQYIYFTSGGNSQWAEMEAAQSFSNGSSIVSGYSNTDVAAYLNAGTTGNILPAANITYDIGTATKRWKDIWLANSTIYLGTANISETNGNLMLPANVNVGTALLSAAGGNLTLPANVNVGSSVITSSGGNLALPPNTTIGGTLALSPRISNVQIATASWVVKDDTAVALEGGYIIINGSGFVSGASVLINTTAAASATVVNSTTIRAQVNAASAGTYVVYVINPDGSVAILVNGLTYSGTPTWITDSTLPLQYSNTNISLQLAAANANVYAVSPGNILPTGLSLSTSGLLSGNITTISTDTVYSFSIDAIDTELQESPRTFSLSVSVIVADPYFKYTTLLLPGNGSNNANNSLFLDSSTNNFTVTRNGNTTQGTFSPYSSNSGYWSSYFDGTGDYLSLAGNVAFDFGAPSGNTNDFTLECWVYVAANSTANPDGNKVAALFSMIVSSQYVMTWLIDGNASTTGTSITLYSGTNGAGALSFTGSSINQNTWNHLAITRSGTSFRLFINGTQAGSTITNSASWGSNSTAAGVVRIGRLADSSYFDELNGYISNFRIVKGTAVYTVNFTPPSTPLISLSGTSLLTCQSNQFKDNSTNNFAITANGDAVITNFAPFNPTVPYRAGTNGGSGYFNGTSDYLTGIGTTSSFNFMHNTTALFTFECWVYVTGTTDMVLFSTNNDISSGIGATIQLFGGNKVNAYITKGVSGTTQTVFYDSGNATAFAINQWVHIAFTYDQSLGSNNGKYYINGVLDRQVTKLANAPSSSAASTAGVVGAATPTGTNLFKGYIAGMRITNSIVYSSNFTPPTGPVSAIANTALLLNFVNAGVTDATAKNVLQTAGDAKISTVQSKWGGSSMYFDGTGDYLVLPSNPNFAFGTGDFTVEAWVYLTANQSSGTMFLSSTTGLGNALHIMITNANKIRVTNETTEFLLATNAISLNTWTHVAVVRSGTTLTIYQGGNANGSTTNSTSFIQNGALVGLEPVGGSFYYTGYIDDLRITKGIARYTGSNFITPTQAFPVQ